MATVSFRGELLLTQDELTEFNTKLDKACLEIYGLDSALVPWRLSSVDQPIRTHTPSSISLAAVLRELDATVDPAVILTQPLNRRSSYKHDKSPSRSPQQRPTPVTSPPPPVPVVEFNEPEPVVVVEKIEYDPESDIYKLLHPPQDALTNLPPWVKSLHAIIVELCYMPAIKPFLKYFKEMFPEEELADDNKDGMDLDATSKRRQKSDKMDDLDFDDLSDDLHDILMDIDETSDKKVENGQEVMVKTEAFDENNMDGRVKSELGSLDNYVKIENVNNSDTYGTARPADFEKTDKPTDKVEDGNKHGDKVEVEKDVHDVEMEKHVDQREPESVDAYNPDGGSQSVNVFDEDKLNHVNHVEESQENSQEQAEEGKEEAKPKEPEKCRVERLLEELLANSFENSSKVFSLMYMFLVERFRASKPGSHEWMCAQDLSNKLDELRTQNGLTDAEKLHGVVEPAPAARVLPAPPEPAQTQLPEKKRPRNSMEDFEHELALINNVNEFTPPISLPEVKNITDDERMEFYENIISLDHEFHLELFTVFEHAAVWKLVGNGEIELDDQNTDPKIYRGMIKWVKEKRNSSLASQNGLGLSQVSQVVV